MKKILAISTLLLASASANAGVVSAAGGVSWETGGNTLPNFSATIDFTQWWTTDNTADVNGGTLAGTSIAPTVSSLGTSLALGDAPELVGAGKFQLGTGVGEPNCNGCELTFAFGGLFFQADPNEPIDATDGWLNVYVDYDKVGGQFDEALIVDAASAATQAVNATDGTLWVSLALRDFIYTPTADYLALGEPLLDGNSAFFGEVLGGIAADNFVTDFFLGVYEADAFGLTSRFDDNRRAPNDASGLNVQNYSVRGTGNVEAATVVEPSTIALFGLSLIGFGAAQRRKKK